MGSKDHSEMGKKAGRSCRSLGPLVNERGSAMVIALLIMALLLGFTALAISRTNSETVASANDAAESRAFEASHASLEVMTRNFSKIFETKLNPDPSDLARVESQTPPGFNDYTFDQVIDQTDATTSVIMTEGQFQGLTALRDGWRLNSTTVNDRNGVQVTLSRRFMNNRIPIFQFGIFYDDDLEFHPGPRFDFGGRVHSNGSLFLQAGTRLNFSSKVTTRRHVFTDVSKNGTPWSPTWNDEVFIKDASGIYRQLQFNMGSVLAATVNGAPVADDPLPTAYPNANWDTSSALFQGNLLAYQRPLELPLKLNSNITGQNLDLVELLKRSKSVGDLYNDGTGTVASPNIIPVTATSKDDLVTASERYSNKTGIRIHLADSKQKLPGCAAAGNGDQCGVRLEGDTLGVGADAGAGAARGYQPLPMSDGYRATRVNGERFAIPGRGSWIKIETVVYNPATQVYDTVDITEDILSLGVTQQAEVGVIRDASYTTGSNGTDGRSIVQLQRFRISGADLPESTYITNNYVIPSNVPNGGTGTETCAASPRTAQDTGVFAPSGFTGDHVDHLKTANVGGVAGTFGCIVPFPINMFDTREGLYNETTGTFNPVTHYGTTGTRKRVPWAGVMSMVEINVGNLRRFMRGDFDGGVGVPALPASQTPFSDAHSRPLRSTDIPNANGIVLYISDRRGDFDFDGEYDMEDVFGGNDGIMQAGEDLQRPGQLGFGVLSADYTNEAVEYRGTVWGTGTATDWDQFAEGDIAGTFEHKFYRRGVRLVNAEQLPGSYDPLFPTTTRGFTVASENAVYVQGNYNASSITNVGTPTASTDYRPINHVPASIAADAVYILSNAWNDSQSFSSPFDTNPSRMASETFARFAILSGDTITGLVGTGAHQGGNDLRMNGGVHNFKRFLEDWGGVRLNYCGSLINLFNSHNNNGTYKNGGGKVYNPPNRNWVFDTTFLDINRIPPGTPFFQAIQITGFERRN